MRSLTNKLVARIKSAQQDDGATLILVLALISVVSIISLALLTLSETNLRASVKTLETADRAYDEDAAMQAGVNAIRISEYDNDTAQAQECPPLPFSGPNLGSSYVITCQPVEGSGAASGGTGTNPNNAPASALLTLGGSGVDGGVGIERSGSGGGILVINGQTYSRSDLENQTGATNAIELTTGQAFARGDCTGTITSDPAADCNTTQDPNGSTDPDYAQPTAGLTPREVPDCTKGKDTVVEFEPGYYDDAAGLTDLFDTCKAKKHVFWFQPTSDGTPGRYYFDFKNGQSPAFPGGSVWTIDDKNIRMVAGKPLGWDPNDKKPDPIFPNSCESPLDETTNGGVEFVFGGRSQLEVLKGSVEICGHYRTNSPPTAVFGATDSTANLPTTPQTTVRDSAENAGCDVGFSTRSLITYLDDELATAAVPNVNSKQSACVDIVGFAPTPTDAIPAGSTLVNATLVIRHSEGSVGNKDVDFTVELTPDRAGADAIKLTTDDLSVSSALTTVYSDVTSDLFDEVKANGYEGSTINYLLDIKKKNEAELKLDTVQLVLDWIPPSVRAQDVSGIKTFSSGGTYTLPVEVQTSANGTSTSNYNATGTRSANSNCVASTDFPSTGCAFLSTGNSKDAELFVQGTLYAPLAAFELRQLELEHPVVTNGTIVRKLYVNGLTTVTDATGPVSAVLSVAAVSPPSVPLEVYFWSFLCLNPDGCPDIDNASPDYPYLADDPLQWELIGTSRVRYTNGPGFPAQQGNRDVAVMSWQFVSPYERP